MIKYNYGLQNYSRKKPSEKCHSARKKNVEYSAQSQFLWSVFRRQYPIGNYIVDFVCLSKQIIIEIDGGQHGVNIKEDAERTAYLNSKGYRVCRFWNNEIDQNIDGVYQKLKEIFGIKD